MSVRSIRAIIQSEVYAFGVISKLVDHYYPGEAATLWKEGRKWTRRSRDLCASVCRYPSLSVEL